MNLIIVLYASVVGWITAHGLFPYWVTVLFGMTLGLAAAYLDHRHQRIVLVAATETLDRIIKAMEKGIEANRTDTESAT